ncbi:MAG TPA: imidazolonepropionase [Anaerolineae bacterium]|nr:imidazolonepropionase [Anaerolineae bacterium]
MDIDLLIARASQLLVILPHDDGPQRGTRLGDLGLIEDGAVAIRGEQIVAVGPTSDLAAQFKAKQVIDAAGKVVMPGFVDPHTHVVWAGDRAAEFEQRIAGATYLEIMNAGGGIMATVRQTRAASVDQLVEETRPRLDRMLAHGATTVEAKTGYGLETATELRMLEAIDRLDAEHPIELVPTFIGAHAIPSEYKGREDAYADLVVNEMLPAVRESPIANRVSRIAYRESHIANRISHIADGTSSSSDLQSPPISDKPSAISDKPSAIRDTLYCDVFCEEGAFTLAQSRKILEAARALGFGLKIHADEFAPLGGAQLAVELGAASADHLVVTPPHEIEALGRSNTVAVSLPGTPFGLGQTAFTPVQAILGAGGVLALASDCNPGTTWCESMQMVIAVACRYLRITPAQAIVASTLNAAHAIGLGDRIGSLQPGRQADVVILDAPDYRHIGYRYGVNLVEKVIKRGRIAISRK